VRARPTRRPFAKRARLGRSVRAPRAGTRSKVRHGALGGEYRSDTAMTPRIIVIRLALFLLVAPFLSFAAGDVALQIWNKHPRHAKTQQTDSSTFTSKTTPGILATVFTPVVLRLAGDIAAWDPILVPSLVSRPPFVPPRV